MNQRVGFLFPVPGLIFGAFLLLAGLISLFEIWYLGLAFILISGFFLTASYGSEIDIQNGKFREYGSIYFIKRGKWIALDKLPEITVKKSRDGMTIHSRTNHSTTLIDNRFEVCLLSATHRTKCLVQKFDSKDEATVFAHKLANQLNKSLVQYQPQLSDKTRARRK